MTDVNTNIDDFYALPQSSDMKWETILTRLISVPRTRADLERRLRERGCPREAADELLDRYEQAGLIDDRAYAVLYVDSKRDFGILRLRDELRARGVSRENIDDALDECEVDEAERAFCLLERWHALPGMTPEKLDGRLRRRGFTGAAVREAMARLRSAAEDE